MTELKKDFYHKSVLVNEVLEYLKPQPGKTYVDATFGGGGHTRAILEAEPKCKVIAFDWDKVAIETNKPQLEEEFGDRLEVIWGNFAQMYKLLRKEGIFQIDGVLADFGTSQHQIFEQAGFSVHKDTPLDMRMSPSHQRLTAEEVVNKGSLKLLRDIFWKYGEEKNTKRIVDAIIEMREKTRIKTTFQLVKLIESVSFKSSREKIHPATRVFQALRIYVNDELGNIDSFLKASVKMVRPGGRIVCISFHSLEDRPVKQFFREQEQLGILTVLSKKSVTASEQELEANRSSRSAKLRAAEVLKNPE
ncbi:MAG: Ribosomal RNA small subunit methyltransferase H [candidate division TM6 bacterium GW2011_GWF2_32_72]|nr:MAG: Ribosomal RNA small subunit methyltransferase H [candidate division TM6 bacterium GW2011_GWF2_32_72]